MAPLVDADVPVYQNCPTETVTVNADSGGDSAVVTWDPITAEDDEGNVTVTANYENGVRLDIGTYDVEYQAVDTSGNIAYCRFTVAVLGRSNSFLPKFNFYFHPVA